MTDTTILGLPEAAGYFGVSISVLRRAIRAGHIPGPSPLTATSVFPADWFETAKAALAEHPKALNRNLKQKAPAFAHYQGTSAWRKYATRVRDYAAFKAKQAA